MDTRLRVRDEWKGRPIESFRTSAEAAFLIGVSVETWKGYRRPNRKRPPRVPAPEPAAYCGPMPLWHDDQLTAMTAARRALGLTTKED